MINLDKIKQKKDDLRVQLAEALREGDDKKIGEAMDGFMSFMSETIMAEASGIGEAADKSVLAVDAFQDCFLPLLEAFIS